MYYQGALWDAFLVRKQQAGTDRGWASLIQMALLSHWDDISEMAGHVAGAIRQQRDSGKAAVAEIAHSLVL